MSSTRSAYAVERGRLLRMFGWKLRAERERRNLSQEGFAEAASLHRNAVGVIERGECEPGLLTLLILADALGVAPHVLLGGLPAPLERRARRCRRA
jgi:transcriptional regulator with XRE-family HTH domain